jgi:uncharacterized cupin superfamily protein
MSSPFVVTRLPDVADAGPGPGQEIRFAREALEAERTGVTYHRLAPGTRSAIGHRHEEAEEVFVVIGGSGRARLDEEVVELERLDAIRIAPTVIRAFEAGPEGLEYVAVGAHHPGDGEVFPGWWGGPA